MQLRNNGSSTAEPVGVCGEWNGNRRLRLKKLIRNGNNKSNAYNNYRMCITAPKLL